MDKQKTRDIKEEILDTASELFYTHGYHVGVDRIIADARIAKMSFYKYFPRKRDCISAVIDRVCRRTERRLREIAADVSLEPFEQACSSFEFLGQSMNEADYLGALIPQALIEIHDRGEADGEMAHNCAKRILARLASACAKAGLNGANVARQIYMAVYGGYLLQDVFGKRSATQAVSEGIIDLLRLKSIAPRCAGRESRGPFF